jgi:hypothetical protein
MLYIIVIIYYRISIYFFYIFFFNLCCFFGANKKLRRHNCMVLDETNFSLLFFLRSFSKLLTALAIHSTID